MIVEIDLGVLRLELDNLSVNELDLRLDQAMREKQREAFSTYLMKHDILDDASRTCPACNVQMISLGLLPRKIGTLSGPITINRRRLRCLSCGLDNYPLDKLIGRNTKHTLPVIERALYLSTDLSYKKTSDTLFKLTGAEISHGQIQSLAKKEGALVGKDLEKMASDLFGLGLDPGEVVHRSKDDTLIVAIDGGNIPDRARDKFEAKVGIVYGIKANVSKNRVALVDRVGYASLENAYKFGQKLLCLARRHGVMSAGRVLAIGDGAGWIRRLVRDFFPGAIYLLDLYHLKRRLKEVLNQDEDGSLGEAIIKTCLEGRPNDALTLLNQFIPKNPEQMEKFRKLKVYIHSNRTGIANYGRTDLFGSGAVEKAIDLIVSRRFKLRGMSWLRPGAAGMLALRLLRFNGEWDKHWQWRMASSA
ncbi:MAG: UPF0236 family transposase-like protein [bacterium]